MSKDNAHVVCNTYNIIAEEVKRYGMNVVIIDIVNKSGITKQQAREMILWCLEQSKGNQ